MRAPCHACGSRVCEGFHRLPRHLRTNGRSGAFGFALVLIVIGLALYLIGGVF